MQHTIDAKGKILGRIASEAAVFLMGKKSADFDRSKLSGQKVEIINASKVKIRPNKLKNKKYIHYTGHPGGLKEEVMNKLIDRKGYGEIFKLAVYGMIPSNKLRPQIMKNLKITD